MRLAVSTSTSAECDLHVAVVASPFVADLVPFGDDVRASLATEATRVRFDAGVGATLFVMVEGRWFGCVGVGEAAPPSLHRRAAARATRLAQQLNARSVALHVTPSAEAAAFAAQGFALTGYRFDAYKTRSPGDADKPRLEHAIVVVAPGCQADVASALDVAEAVCFARDLANEHPGRCTPSFLAEQAVALAGRHDMVATVWDEDELVRRGFNLLLAVGRGSAERPRFIHLKYVGAGDIKRRICLVGKGVTYDSGGYSIKLHEHQVGMHLDMGGAAAVLGAAEAVGRTRPEGVEVHFLVPTAENLVSGTAYKLNEVVRGYGGVSVEVLNTDAEGRLILADALAYAAELDPDEIVDLATLTGACVVALGTETAGLFSNNDELAARLAGAAARADESVWRMPLTPRIEDHLKSDVADMKNVGTRWGGAISAAHFLRRFVGDAPWAHLDIAGPAMTDAEWEHINKGGTGFGVLALHAYVCDER